MEQRTIKREREAIFWNSLFDGSYCLIIEIKLKRISIKENGTNLNEYKFADLFKRLLNCQKSR
jgi:hypothetical protein